MPVKILHVYENKNMLLLSHENTWLYTAYDDNLNNFTYFVTFMHT